MHHDKTTGRTQGLLLADYLKAVVTGQNLPSDLAEQARSSPLFQSAVRGRVPSGTDYSGAFNDVTVAQPVTPEPSTAVSPLVPTSISQPQTSTAAAAPESLLGRTKEAAPGQVAGGLAFTEPRGTERCTSPDQSGQLFVDVRPETSRPYPDVFVVCLTSVANQNNVSVSASPSRGNLTLNPSNWAAGAHWPPNGPVTPGTYTLTASQTGAQAVTETVTVTEPQQQRVLVYPRRGDPGTTFDVYLGGFPRNQPAVLRVYRCDNQPRGGNPLACQDSDNRVYVTSLPPIQVDGSGRAKVSLRSLPSDPKTEFALLSDDMARRVQQTHFIGGDADSVGKAWFCTAPAPTCTIERDASPG